MKELNNYSINRKMKAKKVSCLIQYNIEKKPRGVGHNEYSSYRWRGQWFISKWFFKFSPSYNNICLTKGTKGKMIDFIIYFIAFFITVPILATWIVYKISFKLFGHKWKAIHFSVNWTTILYMIAVLILLSNIFDQQLIGVILVLLLSTLAVIIILQWRTRTEVVLPKALKTLWRLCFLIFLILYICLLLIGIIQRIFL